MYCSLSIRFKIEALIYFFRNHGQMMGPLMSAVRPLFPIIPVMRGPQAETNDDRHVLAKVNNIQLSKEKLQSVENMVVSVEKTLKFISDKFAEEQKSVEDKTSDERLLKGVMRVGLLAKNLLLNFDNEVLISPLLFWTNGALFSGESCYAMFRNSYGIFTEEDRELVSRARRGFSKNIYY